MFVLIVTVGNSLLSLHLLGLNDVPIDALLDAFYGDFVPLLLQ